MRKILGMFILAQLVMLQAPVLEAKASVPVEKKSVIEMVSTRSQDFEWHYRTYNGRKQKRLWSITESKWLTGWIDC